MIRASNPVQYDRMTTADFRGFLVKLTNPDYLRSTVEYLINQIRKSLSKSTMVTQKDLIIPVFYGDTGKKSAEVQIPLRPAQNTAILPPQPPTQVVAQSGNVTPLTYFNGVPIMLQMDQVKFLQAYYSVENNAAVLCVKNEAGIPYKVKQQSSNLFTFTNGRVNRETNGGLQLQFTLQGAYLIVWRQVQNSLKPLYQFDLTKYPAQFVYSYDQTQ